jgi:hypothetical protein
VRVHLPGKHPRELKLLDAPLDLGDVALDVAKARLIALRLDQVKELAAVAEPTGNDIELRDRPFQPRTLAAEFLGTLRRVPDLRVLELAVYLLESLALAVVLKGTP